jgi:hypothetical protein
MTIAVEQWTVLEIPFPKGDSNSAIEVGAKVAFTHEQGTLQAEAFWVDEDDIRVRISPPYVGMWTWRVMGSAGEASGRFECISGTSHGPVRVTDDGFHFVYADGTPYLAFGTTVYAWNHQAHVMQEKTLRSLAASPFNKVRMCIFPKSMSYNRAEPERHAFERRPDGGWNVHRPNPSFWEALDDSIKHLADLGIEADLILFHPYDRWGYSTLSWDDSMAYVRHCVRRLSAHRNLWWSLANEYDMLFDRTLEEWNEAGEYIASHDPCGHLLSIHNWLRVFDARAAWTSHSSVQTRDVHRVSEWKEATGKPVVIDECGYEGDLEENWGHLSGRDLVHLIWNAVLDGGYASHGETFLEDGDLIWWAKGGRLRGDSVVRIGFLRQLVEDLGGRFERRLQPAPRDPNGMEPAFARRIRAEFERADESVLATMRPRLHSYEAVSANGSIIRYLGRSRQRSLDWNLPAGHFCIEIVDAWEMTKRPLIPQASGPTLVPLPSREGTALIATPIRPKVTT